MNVNDMVRGIGYPGIAFHVGLNTAGSALGGALGARVFSNLSAATGALIGACGAVAEVVTNIALNIFYPKWQENGLLQHLPNAVKFTTIITCLREYGVTSFGSSFLFASSITLVPIVLSVLVVLAILKSADQSPKENAV